MRTFTILALVAAATAARAQTSNRTLSFAEHGFAIDAPAGHDDEKVHQVVALYLPQTGGFAPNVNVQVQPFAGTMDEYIAISRDQFKANGVKLVTEKHDAKSATLEYTGALQGHALHWYARAYRGKKGIVLATATTDESQWTSAGPALRRSVDSLHLLP